MNQVDKWKKAIEFYARREHWMGLTENDDCPKVLVANGCCESTEGWAMAEWARDPCKTCGGTRIVSDGKGAPRSGLGKDWGGHYCPDCT